MYSLKTGFRTILFLAMYWLLVGCDPTEVQTEPPAIGAKIQTARFSQDVGGSDLRCTANISTDIPEEVARRYDISQDPGTGIVSCIHDGASAITGVYRVTGRTNQAIEFQAFTTNEVETWVAPYTAAATLPVEFNITVEGEGVKETVSFSTAEE